MSKYKIFLDKNEIFKANIAIEGAKLSSAKARLVLNVNENVNLLYNGTIKENGACEIKISNIASLLEEQDKGEMILEVIADDVLIEAWKSDFIVDRKIKTEVETKEDNLVESTIPKVTVNAVMVEEQRDKVRDDIKELCKKLNIDLVKENKEDIMKVISKYKSKKRLKISENTIYNKII